MSTTVSNKDVATLRKGNVNTMVDLGGGVVYAPIGGGYSTSGLSTEVVVQSNRCARRLLQMQQAMVQDIEAIAKEATAKGGRFPGAPTLRTPN